MNEIAADPEDVDITADEKTSIVSSEKKPNDEDRGENKILTPKNQPWFELTPYAGEWYWVLWAENGRPLAVGGRGYANKLKAVEAIKNVIKTAVDETKICVAYEHGKKDGGE